MTAPINRWRSTYWYGSPIYLASTAIPTEGLLTVSALLIPDGLALTDMGVEITVVGSAGAVVRLCIYELSTTGVSATLIQDAGTVSGTAVATPSLPLTIPARTTPWYALLGAIVQGAATTRPTMRCIAANPQRAPFGRATLNTTTMTNTGHNGYLAQTVTGAPPASATTINEKDIVPRIMVRGNQA